MNSGLQLGVWAVKESHDLLWQSQRAQWKWQTLSFEAERGWTGMFMEGFGNMHANSCKNQHSSNSDNEFTESFAVLR